MTMTGLRTPKVKPSLRKAASKDSLIYKLGHVVGARSLKPSSKNTKAKSSNSESPTQSKPEASGDE